MPRDFSSTSDGTLLKRFQSGEDDAATAIYARYAQRLIQMTDRNTGADLATRVDAEDIVQSVFRTFFRRAADGLYQIPDGEELWKLLLVIALNKLRDSADFHRAKKRDVKHTQSMGTLDAQGKDFAAEILRMTIDELLVSLPNSHAQIIRDRIDGFEIAEIANRVSISQRTVERVLQTFRKRLRSELDCQE